MYQALNATSKTLRDFLRTQILADGFLNAPTSPWNMRGMQVRQNTPAEMDENGEEGLSLWLYRVVRDGERLNDPPLRISATQLKAPPLLDQPSWAIRQPPGGRVGQGTARKAGWLIG